MLPHEDLMRLAIVEAQLARDAGDVPVGCVVIDDATGEIIGRGRNRREVDADPTGHAEIVAMREAAKRRGRWRLDGVTVVVTLEPCPMCAGAMVNARVSRVVFGCTDPKAGAAGTLLDLCRHPKLNHRLEVIGDVLAGECAALLGEFFRAQRALGKK